MGESKIDLSERLLTRRDQLLVDVGEQLYKDSIKNGDAFNKEIYKYAGAAITIYTVLAAFILPDKFDIPGWWRTSLALLPAICFLAAMAASAWGQFTPVRSMNLASFASIDELRSQTLKHQSQKGGFGIWALALGLFLMPIALGVLKNAPTDKAPDQPQYAIVVDQESGVTCGAILTQTENGELVLQTTASGDLKSISDATAVHLIDKCPVTEIEAT